MEQGEALEIHSSVEVGITAAAAQAKAMVESRYYMALRHPRNWDQVRQDILRECQRPRFAANKSTYYHKPIGRGVEGLGIRFVETALRCMTNVMVEVEMVYEDEGKEVHRVTVTDLESNLTYPMDIRISKTIERSRPDSDGSFISVRKNAKGIETFTIVATEEDMLNKRMALISKTIRTLGLRILPGEIKEEAEELILKIRRNTAATDPEGEKRRMCDKYAEIGVRVLDLEEYLGHGVGQIAPHEIVELMGLYGAIRDGEATWQGAIEGARPVVDIVSPSPTFPLPQAPQAPQAPEAPEASLNEWLESEGISEGDFARYLQNVGWLEPGEERILTVGIARVNLIEKNRAKFSEEARAYLMTLPKEPEF